MPKQHGRVRQGQVEAKNQPENFSLVLLMLHKPKEVSGALVEGFSECI